MALLRKLVLTNFQSPGDVLMLSAAVRDLHRAAPGVFLTDLRTSCGPLWDNNPHITRFPEPWIESEAALARDSRPPKTRERDGITFIPCVYPGVNRSNQSPMHFVGGFHECLEDELKLKIPVADFRAEVFLSADEKGWINQVAAECGIRDEFWLVNSGGKWDYTSKWPNPHTVQQAVDFFSKQIVFVQVGDAGNWQPELRGVINMVGRTDLRQLIRLIYHSSGILTPLNGLMHLAAAVPVRPGWPERACVVIAGAREPTHWEAYPFHRYLSTQGCLPCGSPGACWKARCTPVGDGDQKDSADAICQNYVELDRLPPSLLCRTPVYKIRIAKCLQMIAAGDIIRAIAWYYEGGNLKYRRTA